MELGSTDGELLQIHTVQLLVETNQYCAVYRFLNTSAPFLGKDLDIISTGTGVNFLPVYVKIPKLHADSELPHSSTLKKVQKLLNFSLWQQCLHIHESTCFKNCNKRNNLLTYSITPRREANRFSASKEISPHFIEPDGSLPHSQEPVTCPYPEPARSCPCPHNPLPEDPPSHLRLDLPSGLITLRPPHQNLVYASPLPPYVLRAPPISFSIFIT